MKPSDHESDGGKFDEGECFDVEALPVLGQAAAAAPAKVYSTTQRRGCTTKPLGLIGPRDDFDMDLGGRFLQPFLEPRSLISDIGVELEQEGIEPEQGGHHRYAAIAVLSAV